LRPAPRRLASLVDADAVRRGANARKVCGSFKTIPALRNHQGTAYPGQHEAIIDPEPWQIVQDKLTANRRERSLAVGAEAPSLLAGLIVDADATL
jgi:hypothetical protein